MKHRHNRLAVALTLAGAIAMAPVFAAAAERQTGAVSTQPAPAAPATPPAPAAVATPKTPAAPPTPSPLALQIKLGCFVSAGGFGATGLIVFVTNTTSKALPAGQKISWRPISSKGWNIHTLLFPLEPGAHRAVGAVIYTTKNSCEAFVGG